MKKKWTHPEYNDLYEGFYKWIKPPKGKKERVFVLTNGSRTISMESWQKAVKDGWVKK